MSDKKPSKLPDRRDFLKFAGAALTGAGVGLKSMASEIERGAAKKQIPVPPHTENVRAYVAGKKNPSYTISDAMILTGVISTAAGLVPKKPEYDPYAGFKIYVPSRRELLQTAAIMGGAGISSHVLGKWMGAGVIERAVQQHTKEQAQKGAHKTVPSQKAVSGNFAPATTWQEEQQRRDEQPKAGRIR